MPKVHLAVTGAEVTVEANYASVAELSQQALTLLTAASALDDTKRPPAAVGFTAQVVDRSRRGPQVTI